jgi:hypothetical protein
VRTDTEHHLLSSGDRLERIRYFTAPVGQLGREGEAERQRIWLRAVKTIQGLDVVRGFHRGNKPRDRKEKQSDVNIAVEMLLDAVGPDSYQHAILLSGDDDLIPAVKAVCRRIEPARTVDVWSPLAEPSARWRGLSAMTSHVTLATVGPEMLLDSRLPDRIERDGSAIECPHYWRLPPEQEKLWLLRSRLKLKATARPLVGIGPEELATALIQGKY